MLLSIFKIYLKKKSDNLYRLNAPVSLSRHWFKCVPNLLRFVLNEKNALQVRKVPGGTGVSQQTYRQSGTEKDAHNYGDVREWSAFQTDWHRDDYALPYPNHFVLQQL